MLVNELHNNWDEQFPYEEFGYNNLVSAATGLTPNEVYMGRFPRLPLTIFDRTGVAGHQSLARDHLAYCDLATDRQQRAYDIVPEHHALTVSRVECRNSALSDALRAVPKFAVGGWVWCTTRLPPSAKARRRTRTSRTPGQALAQLDRPLQGPRSWPLYPR